MNNVSDLEPCDGAIRIKLLAENPLSNNAFLPFGRSQSSHVPFSSMESYSSRAALCQSLDSDDAMASLRLVGSPIS